MFTLITGTTNGLGKSIAEILLKNKFKVIGVDKRKNKFFRDKNFYSFKLNLKNNKEVHNFINKLEKKKFLPDYFILNAGINLYDNNKYFDLNKFKKCFEINFYGVMNFVDALENLRIKNKHVVCISSTSNIIPNPTALGYFSSKVLLKKNFSILNLNRTNIYKTIILSPVKTKISRNMKPPKGLGGMIYNMLAINAEDAANKIINFSKNKRKIIHITKIAFFIYYIIKFCMIFLPKLYTGGKK